MIVGEIKKSWVCLLLKAFKEMAFGYECGYDNNDGPVKSRVDVFIEI